MTAKEPTGQDPAGRPSTAITAAQGPSTELTSSDDLSREITASLDAPRRPKRTALRGLLLGVTPLAAIAIVTYLYATGGRFVSTENAYVKAEIISISPSIDGQVTDVLVAENQTVEEGDPLFTIDSRPFEMAMAAAQADLAAVAQKIESLRAHYREGEMEIAAAQERIRYLDGEQTRQQSLSSKGFGTQAKLDAAEHELTMGRRRLRVLQETNRMVLADLGGAFDRPVETHPLYLRAAADLERAALDLSYSAIYAPATGTISNLSLEPGEYVEAGEPLFALVTINEPWIEVNLKEVQLTHVRVGQKATVVVDSYPEVTWQAMVDSIAPATGAEFAVLPAQNATGNWVKVVQRIPVRLKLAPRQHMELLRSGMTATVSIDTGYERDMVQIFKSVVAQPFEQ